MKLLSDWTFHYFALMYNGSSVRYEFGFSVIAMEWFDKISEFMEGLPEWLQAHPRYGYLIVAGILLLWLVGIVCGWRWTYSRPGSWEGNFWLGTLGERSYRFWLGLIVAAAAGCALLLFSVTG